MGNTQRHDVNVRSNISHVFIIKSVLMVRVVN